MKHWQKDNSLQHWLRHSLLPITALLLFLAVPKSWLTSVNTPIISHTLTIEISKQTKEPEIIKTKVEEKLEPPKPIIDKQKPKLTDTPPQVKTEATKPPIPKSSISMQLDKTTTQENKPEINASDVQLMMSKVVDPKIENTLFTARSGNNNFINKQHASINHYADLPYLDESVDAPRLQMEFYSAGYMGSVERFFDKITYEKTFTTKYGTKIKCAVVGVLAMCGWK